MNLLTMLTQASVPPETRKRGSNLSSIHDAQRRATENKYRKHLQGQTLTTTELAKYQGDVYAYAIRALKLEGLK